MYLYARGHRIWEQGHRQVSTCTYVHLLHCNNMYTNLTVCCDLNSKIKTVFQKFAYTIVSLFSAINVHTIKMRQKCLHNNYVFDCFLLTSIQSDGPTPSTVIVSERLSRTNFTAVGFLLVAMVTGTCQR